MLLSAIVTDICSRVGITAALIDVTALTDDVLGYQIPRQMPARTALETLMVAYNFVACEEDWKLVFKKRGTTSIATITTKELRAHPAGSQAPDRSVETRTQDMELPTHLTLSYESKVRDYEIATQHAVRVDKAAFLQKSAAIGIVLDDDYAKQQTEIILKQMWGGRHKYAFSTTYKYLKLAPGDVVTVAGKDMRISDVADRGGILDFVADSEEAGVYTSTATADDLAIGVVDLTLVNYIPLFMLIDIPALEADAPSYGLTAIMYGNASYRGGTIQKSTDGGTTWSNAAYFNSTSAKVGTCTNTLGAGSEPGLDTVSTVTVDLSASLGTLASSLQTCIIGSAANGWEILQFTTATLVSGNTYTLTNFYRGLYGTGAEMGGHGAGETFILVTLGNGMSYVSASLSEVGNTYLFCAMNSNNGIGASVSYTIGNKLAQLSLTMRKAVHKGKANKLTLTTP